MDTKDTWKDRKSSFFSHRECEYFSCHETDDPDNFQCLFCYCPLYVLGRDCGGNFRYSKSGKKVCTDCSFPHKRENYAIIRDRYREIMERVDALERAAHAGEQGERDDK